MVVGDDEVIRHRQAEPGALADFLGGEEGFEGALAHVLAHADAIVLHLDFRPGRIESICAQYDPPRLTVVFALVDGLRGIFQQVEQHLFEVRWRCRAPADAKGRIGE